MWGPNPHFEAANASDSKSTTQVPCVALNAANDCPADESVVFPDGSTLEIQGVQRGGGPGRYLGSARDGSVREIGE